MSFIHFCLRAVSLARHGPPYVTKANKGYLRGFTYDYMASIAGEFFAEVVRHRISRKGIERVKIHKNNGQRVILFSGMPDFLLKNFAELLGVNEYYGSVMEIRDGKFTGRTLGTFPLGKGKINALEEIIGGKYPTSHFATGNLADASRKSPVEWADITFYADHWLDRYLLEKVGHPVAVNPGEKLRRLAESTAWPTEIFD